MYFEKISKKQFQVDVQTNFVYFESFLSEELSNKSISNLTDYIYDRIVLPKRATEKSAGYDFFFPIDLIIKPNENIIIPTGIKCNMNDIQNVVLNLYPRSGHGFKYRLRLNNTVGIIDADYYNNNDNEGHIFVNLSNEGSREIKISKGTGFCQGVFSQFLLTKNDVEKGQRIGGLGSSSPPDLNFEKNKKNFEIFWNLYPVKKQDKENVFLQYLETIDSQDLNATIVLNKLKTYISICKKQKREEKYIKNPINFLIGLQKEDYNIK